MTTTAQPATMIGESKDSVGQLRADEERHVGRVVEVYETRIAEDCARIQAFTGDSANNKQVNTERPFLTWQCCGVHRELAAERARLNERAERLGVKTTYQNSIRELSLR